MIVVIQCAAIVVDKINIISPDYHAASLISCDALLSSAN